jgi:hypothetical protein
MHLLVLLLSSVRRHREWQAAQPPPLPAELPGRVLLLARLPSAPGALTSSNEDNSNSGQPAGGAKSKQTAVADCDAWKAFWLTGAELAGGGVRMSRHVVSDHWPSRLLGALGQLSGAAVEVSKDDAAKQV